MQALGAELAPVLVPLPLLPLATIAAAPPTRRLCTTQMLDVKESLHISSMTRCCMLRGVSH